MSQSALIIIDIQNEITKNYKEVIHNINQAIDWAVTEHLPVIYIRHENLTPGAKVLKPNTPGAELASDLKVVSDHIFTKSKTNILTSDELVQFIEENGFQEFYVAGADAAICVKSSCFNLRKAHYGVKVLKDCITSYDKRKIDEMLEYYESKGCQLITLSDL